MEATRGNIRHTWCLPSIANVETRKVYSSAPAAAATMPTQRTLRAMKHKHMHIWRAHTHVDNTKVVISMLAQGGQGKTACRARLQGERMYQVSGT
jgi:hypothetical protein